LKRKIMLKILMDMYGVLLPLVSELVELDQNYLLMKYEFILQWILMKQYIP